MIFQKELLCFKLNIKSVNQKKKNKEKERTSLNMSHPAILEFTNCKMINTQFSTTYKTNHSATASMCLGFTMNH